MKDIIELNKELEKIYKPEIYFHNDYQTFSIFNTWVVEADYNYFYKWEQKVKSKIDGIADINSPSKITFIKVFQQDVLDKYRKLIDINTEDFVYLESTFSTIQNTSATKKKPTKKCKEISLEKDNVSCISKEEYESILFKLGVIFHNEDYLPFEDFELTFYGERKRLELLIIENITNNIKEYNEEQLKIREKDRALLKESEEYKEELEEDKEEIENILDKRNPLITTQPEDEWERIYSFVQLSFCLDNIKTLLGNIAEYIDNIVNVIKKLENFEEDEFELDKINDKDPNKHKLEFNLDKIEVAMFYKALHDEEIVYVNNKGQTHSYTNLKKYINSANLNYLEKSKSTPIKNINKEFSKFLNDNKYEEKEIKLLDDLIAKFTKRKKSIIENHQEGLL